MTNNTDISIIIPAKNAGLTISDSIESITKQVGNYAYEILVVDNQSSDDTALVASKHLNTRVISCLGKGVSSTRNLGIASSSGRYIAFLDADDQWLDGKLLYQIQFLDNNPKFILCASAAEYITPTKAVIKKRKTGFTGNASNFLLSGNPIVTSSVTLRRSMITNLPAIFNENISFAEDWLAWLQLAPNGYFHITKQPFVLYTYYPSKKYSFSTVSDSLIQIVSCLLKDELFLKEIHFKTKKIEIIPHLGRISYFMQSHEINMAIKEACNALIIAPTELPAILRRLL